MEIRIAFSAMPSSKEITWEKSLYPVFCAITFQPSPSTSSFTGCVLQSVIGTFVSMPFGATWRRDTVASDVARSIATCPRVTFNRMTPRSFTNPASISIDFSSFS